ncbi:MAG TPA: protein kinase [Chthoniobacterales bacterium]|nr:protein kinase [Chthoniobacterales bacterium]
MAPQLWQEVKEILSEALNREGEERTAYVNEVCAHDPALRKQVETYLSISGEALDACADNLRDTVRNSISRVGARIGAYRVVKEIGRGGMGTVYLGARADGEFEKNVAIKILKRGTDTDEIVKRFRGERQILANLEHQNIARLIDAGSTEDGLPYFVMEFVDGTPVTQFARDHHLSIPERLELLLKICSAVSRSHRDRIIHRDLKPTNILVTEEGDPKILDFGIAKLLDSNGDFIEHTATQQKRFTPTCVSPEQARGETVTMASDVYALGALLYELLTGDTPHRFSSPRPSPEELARVVCDQEVKPPSHAVARPALRQQLKGNLDNITLCALRKDPAHRYSTVQEFADDIRRHLAARPIEARPPTAAYRVQQFLTATPQRRYAALALAAVVVIAGIGLLAQFLLSDRAADLSANQPSGAPGSEQKSIAVLPFDSLNNRPDDSFFVDGVHDNILTDLAKVSDLKVISRSGVEPYRDKPKDTRVIGRELNVAYVLEGSVQKSDDRLRVNVRLIDTKTDAQTWSEHYEGTVEDLHALQSELAQSIVTQLKAKLSPAEKAAIKRTPTEDMQAYSLYLKARALMPPVGVDSEIFHKMADLLDQATARDPKFALAYCFAAEVNVLLYRYSEHSAERLAKAREAAALALEVAPDLGESHLAQAMYYYHGLRDFVSADRELALAGSSLSGKTEFLVLKQVTERRFGHWRDALRDGERALALNPRDPTTAQVLIETYRAVRMYSEAEWLANDMISQLPPASAGNMWSYKCDVAMALGAFDKATEALEKMPAHLPWKTMMRGMVAYYKRDYAEAARIIGTIPPDKRDASDVLFDGMIQRQLGNMDKFRELVLKSKDLYENQLKDRADDPNAYNWLALACAFLDQKEEALALIDRAAELAPLSRDAVDAPNWMMTLAEIHSVTGDKEAALTELEKLAKLPNSPTYGDLANSAMWDGLRDEPRFKQILAEASKPPKYN